MGNEKLRRRRRKKTRNKPASPLDQQKARCEWQFNLTTAISSPGAVGTVSDAIGVVELNEEHRFLATGGIARKIRVYSSEKLLKSRESDDIGIFPVTACEFYIVTPAKLSSLKWKPGSGSRVIGSGDYDGAVFEYDLEKRVAIFERDEHGGRRIWAIDYSRYDDPCLGASGSDDGTMQMWDTRCDEENRVAKIHPNRSSVSPVCCVEFNPFGGPLVAAGCADRRIYGYDVRKLNDPVFVLDRHQKAVTYTRFLDSHTIVSSSIDGCLMMWDLENNDLIRTYKGHLNSKRFVGLSVWGNGGLLGCGSQNNRVFVYDKRWSEPIWVSGSDRMEGEPGFFSAVSWRQTGGERCMLVAGASDGVVQVFEGRRIVGS